jgi:hypothetical protein
MQTVDIKQFLGHRRKSESPMDSPDFQIFAMKVSLLPI